MTLLNTNQTLYIVFAILGAIIVSIIVFYYLFKTKIYRKNYIKKYYKTINYYVLKNDFLLINNFIIKSINVRIDHIIFAKKYIYLINDSYLEGAILPKEEDNKWIYLQYDKHEITTIKNSLNELDECLTKISEYIGLDKSFFYAINVVNNDAYIKYQFNSKNVERLVKKNKLVRTLNELENSAVLKDINQNEIMHAAKKMALLNERDK